MTSKRSALLTLPYHPYHRDMRCSCSRFSRSCRSLAGEVHNVPEGLAVALVLVPRPLAAVSFSQYLVDAFWLDIRQDDYWWFPGKICTVGQLLESTSIQRVALEYVACSLVPWIVMGLLLALGWLTDNIWQSRRRFGNLDCLHRDLDQRPTARTGAPCRTLENRLVFQNPLRRCSFFGVCSECLKILVWRNIYRMPGSYQSNECGAFPQNFPKTVNLLAMQIEVGYQFRPVMGPIGRP